MTPVFERAKTVHALDRAATVIGFPERIPWKKNLKESIIIYGPVDPTRVYVRISIYTYTVCALCLYNICIKQTDFEQIPNK
jgi:hypothetical protein